MCFFRKKKKQKLEAAKAAEKKEFEVQEEPKITASPLMEKEPKKVEKKAKPATKAAEKPVAKEAAKPAAKKDAVRVYHVVKREDGKWAVKFAGGEKVIKLFDTQAEAKEYTAKMAENQGGAMLVHNSKGANKGKIQSK